MPKESLTMGCANPSDIYHWMRRELGEISYMSAYGFHVMPNITPWRVLSFTQFHDSLLESEKTSLIIKRRETEEDYGCYFGLSGNLLLAKSRLSEPSLGYFSQAQVAKVRAELADLGFGTAYASVPSYQGSETQEVFLGINGPENMVLEVDFHKYAEQVIALNQTGRYRIMPNINGIWVDVTSKQNFAHPNAYIDQKAICEDEVDLQHKLDFYAQAYKGLITAVYRAEGVRIPRRRINFRKTSYSPFSDPKEDRKRRKQYLAKDPLSFFEEDI